MKIDGDALFLASRALGEQGRLVTVLSREHGLLRGLMMRRNESILPGDTVRFEHSRRLDGQLGRVSCELAVSRSAFVLDDMTAALVVAYLAETLCGLLPEEHPYPELYDAIERMWLDAAPWWQRLAALERALLGAVGYGLSLADDAVPDASGTPLAYVSPNSGRAVSVAMGAAYADRLLPLPALWGGPPCGTGEDMRRVLRLTGLFLNRASHGKALTARTRLAEHLLQQEVLAHGGHDTQRKYG